MCTNSQLHKHTHTKLSQLHRHTHTHTRIDRLSCISRDDSLSNRSCVGYSSPRFNIFYVPLLHFYGHVIQISKQLKRQELLWAVLKEFAKIFFSFCMKSLHGSQLQTSDLTMVPCLKRDAPPPPIRFFFDFVSCWEENLLCAHHFKDGCRQMIPGFQTHWFACIWGERGNQ